MYKIMSNRCIYPEIQYEAMEPTILVEEGVIWDNRENNIEEQVIDYVDSADSTLIEAENESYVTASEDNTTQYFSVLDSSNQTILSDIADVTIRDSAIQEDIEEALTETSDCTDVNGQVVLFKVDGSDELYGFQLVSDDQGNLQKYQYKVRQNIEGNLEAIPETIQILPVDNLENETDEEQINSEAFQDTENTTHMKEDHTPLVKEEQNVESSTAELESEEIFEEHLDSKEGILELGTPATAEKQEVQEVGNMEPNEYGIRVACNESDDLEEDEEDEEEIYYTHGSLNAENSFKYNNTVTENSAMEDESRPSEGHYEQLFVKESHLMDDTNGIAEENGLEGREVLMDSDNEYDTVDGDHVTGDIEEDMYENPDIRKSPSYQAPTVIFKKKIVKNIIRKVRIQKNDRKTNLLYLVKNVEKENMGRLSCNSMTVKPNPRSILKCSVGATDIHRQDDEEEKYDKRFAKSKEAQQARLFHNFIAQTKIIHAPVRQGRLPRKQQIKPMKRTDEEIVVQEVVVSSNGFIETSEEGVLKERVPLKPTEYIQLSDSDEDFDPRAPHKRKRKTKKRKPMVEITISDSEDESSDRSTRETDEEVSEPRTSINVKRPRGRPPKDHEKDENKEITKRPRGRPPKYPKTQVEEPEEEIIVIKIDNRCPKCPKSFPSEGSLRSHMQFHNFSESKSNDTNYMCEKCGDTFKNSFLLKRHIISHKTGNIVCCICKKVFSDQTQLLVHKRIHVKQRMFKNTILPRHSPKMSKILVTNMCQDCGKTFSSKSALGVHKKQHKRLFCQSCKLPFTCKFTLINHLRLDCVKRKSKTPKKRPFTNKIRQLTVRQNAKPAPIRPEAPIFKPFAPSTSTNAVVTNIKCDSCSMTFATYTSLFKHKVLKHGLDTPDKHMVRNPATKILPRNRAAHSGVRPSLGLKNAFIGLQNKLVTFKNSQKKT